MAHKFAGEWEIVRYNSWKYILHIFVLHTSIKTAYQMCGSENAESYQQTAQQAWHFNGSVQKVLVNSFHYA